MENDKNKWGKMEKQNKTKQKQPSDILEFKRK